MITSLEQLLVNSSATFANHIREVGIFLFSLLFSYFQITGKVKAKGRVCTPHTTRPMGCQWDSHDLNRFRERQIHKSKNELTIKIYLTIVIQLME